MDGALRGHSGKELTIFKKICFEKKEFKLVNLPAF